MKKEFQTQWMHLSNCQGVVIGYDVLPYREDEALEDLPKELAWCNKCAKELCKVVAPVWLNAKPAYALKCTKCGGMHHMYVSMFRQRYIGYDMPGGGHVNATHGVTSFRNAMDRKAQETMANIPKKVEAEMCEILHCTPEEYRAMKAGWDKENAERRKIYEREEADMRAKWDDKKIQQESDNRKELIEKGVLKYVKGIGLVNTETNQIVKL